MQPGDVYAALPGARTHGARFATRARDGGAVACVTDAAGADAARAAGLATYVVDDPRRVLGPLAAWIYGEPARALTTIGVTGTNGKTTTAYLLEAGLRAAGRATGLIGTIETRIGDETVPSVRTTPESTDLQALFAVMRERGVEAVAMEVSSHALALGRVDGTTFDVAVFTNLSQDHLDFHPDLESYFQAKASLFTPERARVAVVDMDDAYGARLARLAAEAGLPVVTVSPAGNEHADWRVEDLVCAPIGQHVHAASAPAASPSPRAPRCPARSTSTTPRSPSSPWSTAGVDAGRRGRRGPGLPRRAGAHGARRDGRAVPRARRLCAQPRLAGAAARHRPRAARARWPADRGRRGRR